MADTRRTLAELVTLLADNVSGDISPQDIRDFLASVTPPYGSFSRLVAAPTTIATPGVYVKVAGTSVIGLVRDFNMPIDGRLRYIGAPTRHVHIAVTTAFTTAGVNNVIGLKIAKNGSLLDNTVARRRVGTGTDIGSTALHGDIMMDTNDYLELFVTNESDTDAVTIDEVYFFGMGMIM